MPVVAKVRAKRVAWLLAYALLSLGLGIWGAYDYLVRIPVHEQNYAAFTKSKETFDQLQKKTEAAPLTANEVAEYEAAKLVIESFKDGIPEPVPVYDRPLQLWVYIVGCGILGTPWCLWSIVKLRRQRIELDGNGTLIANNVRLTADQIESIDMSRWMSKSIATIHGNDGKLVKIDDYMMENAHLIVGSIANRFDPAAWNTDGTKWKPAETTAAESTETVAPAKADSSPRET